MLHAHQVLQLLLLRVERSGISRLVDFSHRLRLTVVGTVSARHQRHPYLRCRGSPQAAEPSQASEPAYLPTHHLNHSQLRLDRTHPQEEKAHLEAVATAATAAVEAEAWRSCPHPRPRLRPRPHPLPSLRTHQHPAPVKIFEIEFHHRTETQRSRIPDLRRLREAGAARSTVGEARPFPNLSSKTHSQHPSHQSNHYQRILPPLPLRSFAARTPLSLNASPWEAVRPRLHGTALRRLSTRQTNRSLPNPVDELEMFRVVSAIRITSPAGALESFASVRQIHGRSASHEIVGSSRLLALAVSRKRALVLPFIAALNDGKLASVNALSRRRVYISPPPPDPRRPRRRPRTRRPTSTAERQLRGRRTSSSRARSTPTSRSCAPVFAPRRARTMDENYSPALVASPSIVYPPSPSAPSSLAVRPATSKPPPRRARAAHLHDGELPEVTAAFSLVPFAATTLDRGRLKHRRSSAFRRRLSPRVASPASPASRSRARARGDETIAERWSGLSRDDGLAPPPRALATVDDGEREREISASPLAPRSLARSPDRARPRRASHVPPPGRMAVPSGHRGGRIDESRAPVIRPNSADRPTDRPTDGANFEIGLVVFHGIQTRVTTTRASRGGARRRRDGDGRDGGVGARAHSRAGRAGAFAFAFDDSVRALAGRARVRVRPVDVSDFDAD